MDGQTQFLSNSERSVMMGYCLMRASQDGSWAPQWQRWLQFSLRKTVGLSQLVVESVVQKLLRLALTTVHLQHHLACFQALEMAKMAIEAGSPLGRVHLAYLDNRFF
jgi:hypothetical protein